VEKGQNPKEINRTYEEYSMRYKKHILLITIVLCCSLISQIAAAAPLTPQEKEQVKWLVGSFEAYVNQGNAQAIIELFSPNMPQDRRQYLTDEIYRRVASGGIRLSFFADLSDENITEIQPGVLYEISGKFKAEGPNWNVSGLKATFTVERVGYYFYIYDTDIFEKMSLKGAGKIVGTVFLVLGIVFFLFVGGLVLIIVLIVRSQKKKKTVGTGDGPGTV
jgi:hypothetical protein